MKETPPFITFHGIDGAGKTTTASIVSEGLIQAGIPTINYDVYEKENITNPFSSAKKAVMKESSPSSQLAFYLGSTMYHSDNISELLQRGYGVVKSRYIDDVLAHHTQLGVQNASKIAALFPIVQPDLKVILTLDEDMRRERILERGEMDSKDNEIRKKGSRLDFFENFLLENSKELIKIGKVIKIDTTELSPDQVSQIIIDHLLNNYLVNGVSHE